MHEERGNISEYLDMISECKEKKKKKKKKNRERYNFKIIRNRRK